MSLERCCRLLVLGLIVACLCACERKPAAPAEGPLPMDAGLMSARRAPGAAEIALLEEIVRFQEELARMHGVMVSVGTLDAWNAEIAGLELTTARARLAQAKLDRPAVEALLKQIVAVREKGVKRAETMMSLGTVGGDDVARAEIALREARLRLLRLEP